MSCTIMVIVPMIVSNWPTILPVLTAAAGAMGFSIRKQARPLAKQQAAVAATACTATVEVSHSALAGESRGQAAMEVENKGVQVRFSIAADGCLRVSAAGEGKSREELTAVARQVADKVVQTYAYHKVLTEAKSLGFGLVEEQVDARGAIHIRLQRD
jgi:hypothetical protein